MPYTFAHIGYILPFQKKYPSFFSTTGLVFGSIAPDYDILFRLTENRFHIFQYDLKSVIFLIYPLAFISAVAFHIICRDRLIEHLPDFFYLKFKNDQKQKFNSLTIRYFIKISFSIITAIYLHLFLDSLCHIMDAYAVKTTILNATHNYYLSELAGIAAIYLLPVLFTIAGFYFIYAVCLKREFKTDMLVFSESKRIWYWSNILILSVLLTIVKLKYTKIQAFFLVDYILISFTSSIIISFYSVSSVYYIQLILSKKKIQ